MSTLLHPTTPSTAAFDLAFPIAVAAYPSYEGAQRAVDHLGQRDFPLGRVQIVGSELRSVEQVTGRLTRARVAGAGALSGLWLGVFVGVASALLSAHASLGLLSITALLGAGFGAVWSLLGYSALTRRGARRYTSISRIRAARYDVLVEYRDADRARAMLSELTEGVPVTG